MATWDRNMALLDLLDLLKSFHVIESSLGLDTKVSALWKVQNNVNRLWDEQDIK